MKKTEKIKKTRSVGNIDKAKKNIIRGERNVGEYDRVLSKSKKEQRPLPCIRVFSAFDCNSFKKCF